MKTRAYMQIPSGSLGDDTPAIITPDDIMRLYYAGKITTYIYNKERPKHIDGWDTYEVHDNIEEIKELAQIIV